MKSEHKVEIYKTLIKTLSFHLSQNLCQVIMLQIKLPIKFGVWLCMMTNIILHVLTMEL